MNNIIWVVVSVDGAVESPRGVFLTRKAARGNCQCWAVFNPGFSFRVRKYRRA